MSHLVPYRLDMRDINILERGRGAGGLTVVVMKRSTDRLFGLLRIGIIFGGEKEVSILQPLERIL